MKKLKIVPIATYEQGKGMTFEQKKAAAAKKGCGIIFEADWRKLTYDDVKDYEDYLPTTLQTKDGLVCAGDVDFDRWRSFGVSFMVDLHGGLLGTPLKKTVRKLAGIYGVVLREANKR